MNSPLDTQPVRRIALFGGTFDPVHIGHLRLLIELQEAFQFDEIIILPCRPKFKQAPLISDAERINLLELAIRDLPLSAVRIDDRELRRQGVTHTIETVTEMRGVFGEAAAISFIMGVDSLASFHQWRAPEKIRSMVNLLVTDRPGYQHSALLEQFETHQQERLATLKQVSYQTAGAVLFYPTTGLPISSSQIRAAIASGKNVNYLLPEPVMAHIIQNKLYGYKR